MTEPSSQQHTLATLQQTLSESIAVAKQHRDASVGTRKELVDGTKQLQKHLKTVVGDADTTSLAKTVIQQYRDAMDQLTKRCKQAEASVVTAQTLLIELEPDITQQQQQVQQLLTTVATLTQEVESATANNNSTAAAASNTTTTPNDAAAQEELQQLRQEIQEYEIEFRSLKNQDITIRTLEDRITELQSSAATALEQAVAAVQVDAQSELHATTEDLQSQLAECQAQTQHYKVQWQSELAFREATQSSLHASDNVVAQREAAWDAQRLLLQSEIQRLQESTTNQQHRSVAAAPRSGSNNNNNNTEEAVLERNAYEAEVRNIEYSFVRSCCCCIADSLTHSLTHSRTHARTHSLAPSCRSYIARRTRGHEYSSPAGFTGATRTSRPGSGRGGPGTRHVATTDTRLASHGRHSRTNGPSGTTSRTDRDDATGIADSQTFRV